MADGPSQAVAIVVPVHRDRLTPDEQVSIRHLDRHLGGYDRFLLVPDGLRFALDGFQLERFPDRYFTSKHNYSRLLLTKRFYRRFSRYEYILVHQLDALVLSDELRVWCAKGYDYIGAVHTIADLPPLVGNGGFSLRRIEGFLDVLTSKRRAVDANWAADWAGEPPESRPRGHLRKRVERLSFFNGVRAEIRRLDRTPHAWPEDWFWSLAAKRFSPGFNIAPNDEADHFAFSAAPRETYARIGRLPFGCHAWSRFDRDFWEPYLLRE